MRWLRDLAWRVGAKLRGCAKVSGCYYVAYCPECRRWFTDVLHGYRGGCYYLRCPRCGSEVLVQP